MVDEFDFGEPFAFFLTCTTYGTWLPGDDRGSWHDGEFLPANQLFREMAASKMRETAFLASREDRDVVESTITKHCKIRDWVLHAVDARSNHVHVVVSAAGYKPETARDQLKAWCTRHLKQLHADRKRFWSEGGSCRSVNRGCDLERVIQYVRDAQDRKGREIQ